MKALNPLDAGDVFEQAACVGRWDLMDATDVRDVPEARRLCARCPVAAECAALAQHINPLAGVWAGVDHDDRRARRARLLGLVA